MQDAFGTREESVFKAASGLHGGIGAKGDVCGSLMGASMMLGMMFGSSIKESARPKEPPKPGEMDVPTRLVGELYDWFKKEFGSVKCRRIRSKHKKEVDADPANRGLTEEERRDKALDRCEEMAGKTAAKAAEMIWDTMKGNPKP